MFTKFWNWLKTIFTPKQIEQAPVKPPQEPTGEPPKQTSPSSGTPWMTLAEKAMGQKEKPGSSQDNEWIVDLFKHTSYKASHDEVPWCAAFVCAMLERSGYKSTKRADAKSFDNYGIRCGLIPGAVITIRHKDGGRHVAFLNRVIDANYVECLGGNQGNAVKNSRYLRSTIVEARWPVK